MGIEGIGAQAGLSTQLVQIQNVQPVSNPQAPAVTATPTTSTDSEPAVTQSAPQVSAPVSAPTTSTPAPEVKRGATVDIKA